MYFHWSYANLYMLRTYLNPKICFFLKISHAGGTLSSVTFISSSRDKRTKQRSYFYASHGIRSFYISALTERKDITELHEKYSTSGITRTPPFSLISRIALSLRAAFARAYL